MISIAHLRKVETKLVGMWFYHSSSSLIMSVELHEKSPASLSEIADWSDHELAVALQQQCKVQLACTALSSPFCKLDTLAKALLTPQYILLWLYHQQL